MNYFDVLFAKKQGGGGTPTLITKTITENGTYNASSDNADGYSQVTVNVPYMEKKSASGDIASFSDGAGYPFLKVKANINPVQDLHGYDYPWVGGAGKNKFDDSSTSNVWVDTNNEVTNLTGAKSVKLATTSGSAWTLSNANSSSPSNILLIAYLDSGNNVLSRSVVADGAKYISATAPNDTAFILASFSNYSNMSNPQLEIGSTATTFAPYSNICPISGFTGVNVTVSSTTTEGSGTVYPISWQDEAGIVYGGYIDLVSGVLVATYGGVDLSTLAWKRSSSALSHFYAGLSTPYKFTSNVVMISSCYKNDGVGNSSIGYYGANGTYRHYYVSQGNPAYEIYIIDEREFADVDAFKTAVSGQKLVYELATPQTYQLTPQQINTLIGQNNAWNNTNGQTEVEYFIPIE